jgi:hypothetical protein
MVRTHPTKTVCLFLVLDAQSFAMFDADKLIFIHCLIHRENPGSQSVTFNSVMEIVVRRVDVIR